MVSTQANGDLPSASDSKEEIRFSSEKETKDRAPLSPLYYPPEHDAVVTISRSTTSPLREPLHKPVPADEYV